MEATARETLLDYDTWAKEVHELAEERGSIIVAHNYQLPWIQDVAHFVGDSKDAVSAGISSVSSPDFLSLWTSPVSRADFWPPVSASKNSVPGSWISRGQKTVRRIGDRGFWEAKWPFEPWP